MQKRTVDLRILLIEITRKCNAKCDQCGSRCDINGEESLTAEEILSALRDIKENIGTDTMINITGGEPLLRTDIFEIMTKVSKMGFDWGMVTNGYFINEDNIRQMKASGMKTITISLDGMKQTHDELRHLPGSFDHIVEGLKLLKKADFLDHIQVTFTANSRNIYELPQVYKLISQIGIDSIRTGCMDDIGRASDNKDLLLSKEELEFYFWFVNRANKKGKVPLVWGCPHYFGDKAERHNFYCFAGIYAASILYNGDIFVCPNVPRRPELIQGNIRQDSFSAVWKDKFEYFRKRPLPEKCKKCQYVDACEGDSLHSMDFDNTEPKFCYSQIFEEKQTEKYKQFLKIKYPNVSAVVVEADEQDAPNVYIEPEAYEDIKHIFHMGRKNPLSMYEQQVGLVGFRVDNDYVVRYVFPANAKNRYKDNAIFTRKIMNLAEYETEVIKRNYYYSDDRKDYVGNSGLIFIGFAHSHPVQSELVYSVGDELLHKKLFAATKGNYVGILINPIHNTIGAYYGKKIKQANLVLLENNADII